MQAASTRAASEASSCLPSSTMLGVNAGLVADHAQLRRPALVDRERLPYQAIEALCRGAGALEEGGRTQRGRAARRSASRWRRRRGRARRAWGSGGRRSPRRRPRAPRCRPSWSRRSRARCGARASRRRSAAWSGRPPWRACSCCNFAGDISFTDFLRRIIVASPRSPQRPSGGICVIHPLPVPDRPRPAALVLRGMLAEVKASAADTGGTPRRDHGAREPSGPAARALPRGRGLLRPRGLGDDPRRRGDRRARPRPARVRPARRPAHVHDRPRRRQDEALGPRAERLRGLHRGRQRAGQAPTVPPASVTPPENAAEIVLRHGMELLPD